MKYTEARQGRIFVIRLEDGDILHESIESFAREQKINAAGLIVLGGADKGSTLVVGPREGRAESIEPMEHVLQGVHEISGTGTLFPDKNGHPVLHMHISCGRSEQTVTGCIRRGIKTWHVLEVILVELLDCTARRLFESASGFELMNPQGTK